MRSILVLLILVMIGLNGKGQSVTALPDSVLSQCCLEVTLLNGNVTTVDWVFIQYITRDGTGTKLFVEYAPNFGGIQWETQIRIQDDFDEVIERSKFIILPFTVATTDYGIHRNWIANIEENTTTGGTWIYGRFGTPTKRKFSAVEDYETLKALLLACRPRAIVVAENGLYTEGDTVRIGGILIENTRIETDTFDFEMIDVLTSTAFGIDHNGVYGDTTFYAGRRWGSFRNLMTISRTAWLHEMQDTTSGERTTILSGLDAFNVPSFEVRTRNGSSSKIAIFQQYKDFGFWLMDDQDTNPNYTQSFILSPTAVGFGSSESSGGEPGNGVSIFANGSGSGDEYISIITKGVDNSTATVGQFLQLQDVLTGEVEYATVDLSSYISGSGTTNYIPKFTGAQSIGNSNLTDDNTRVRVENGKSFSLAKVATTGLPTGAKAYMVYDTTGNGIRWYNGTRWAYALESTFARGMQYRILTFDANGQVINSEVDVRGTISSFNTAIGYQSLSSGTFSGTNNTAIGYRSLYSATTASSNVAIGSQALYSLTVSGNDNVAIGSNALFANVRGQQNVSIGYRTLLAATSGSGNVAIGAAALESFLNPSNMVAIGVNAAKLSTGGDNMVIIGYNAGSNATAPTRGISIGSDVFRVQTAQEGNIGIGYQVGYSNTNGAFNTAVGRFAFYSNLTGSLNSFYGAGAGYNNTGSNNTGYGTNVLFSNTSGVNNTAIGMQAGYNSGGNSVNSRNILIGYQAGNNLNGASNNIVIGYDIDIPSATGTNLMSLGNIIFGTGVDGSGTSVSSGKIGIKKITPDYDFDITTTNAFGLPRGTVAQRPTIVASTTPFRYNTDSTALEYGESVGTWRQLATRSYARSLVAGLNRGNSILDSLPNGSIALDANTNDLEINNATSFFFETSTGENLYLDDGEAGLYGVTYAEISSGDGASSNYENNVSRTLANVYGGTYKVEHLLDSTKFTITSKVVSADKIELKINFDKSASSHSFRPYDKYGLANETPVTGSGLVQAMTWTAGTPAFTYVKKDTTIYIIDADYDFSAAITTAQIAARYNRVIIFMTCSSSASDHNTLTMHTPDANLAQCEIVVYSIDDNLTYRNDITFGASNLLSPTGSLNTTYNLSGGQWLHVRVADVSGYKYFISY